MRNGIRHMTEADRSAVLEMMRVFYSSDAVHTDGSEEIFNSDISECVSDSPFAEGFVFTREEDGSDSGILGYAMLAHSFSTEFGRRCIWVEDIYIREEARGTGFASRFFDMLAEMYPGAMNRLEAELENTRALEVYKRKGFKEMPYLELYR